LLIEAGLRLPGADIGQPADLWQRCSRQASDEGHITLQRSLRGRMVLLTSPAEVNV